MKKKKEKIKTLDLIIVLIGIFMLAFIITMIIIFCIKDSTPDTLIMCVLGTGMGELITTAMITIVKKKYGIKESDTDEDSRQDL